MKKTLFRSIMCWSMILTFILVSFNIPAFAETSNNTSIALSSSTLGIKDTTRVTISNCTTNAKDWVGLYNENDVPGNINSIWWKYLPDLNIENGNGSFNLDLSTISNLKEGNNYKLMLFIDDSYTSLASVSFSISKPSTSISYLQSVQVKTSAGTAPKLPQVVTQVNSDNTTSEINVTWDVIDAYLYSKAGSFTVEGTVQGISDKAKADVTVTDGSDPLYSFQVLSDTHITSDLTAVHDKNFDSALKDINTIDPNSSKLIINGDVTDCGLKSNWDAFSQILNTNKHPNVSASFGNHDTWQDNSWVDQNQYAISKQNYLSYTNSPNIYYDYWLQNNHFIFLGSEKSNGNIAYLSDTQLQWFDKTLAQNAASNKPIFVFIHQPLYDTVSGSKPGQGWNGIEQDTEVKNILAKYPQAILFTGHTHWEFGSKYIMYNEKYCTMFNIPSCAYCWTDANTEDDISEGYYIEVYNDKVLVKGRNFTTKEWAKNAQYEVDYLGTAGNSLIKAIDNFATSQSKAAKLDNLALTADKTTLILNGTDKAHLTIKATMSDGSNADLTKGATIQYSSDNLNIATVNSDGIVTPVSKGAVNITARVTINGITLSSTENITVEKVKTDATLSSIAIDGEVLDTFSSDTTQYNIPLSPNSSKTPIITATTTDCDASVAVTQAKSLQDTATILVTSADRTITKSYIIKFFTSNNVLEKVTKPIFNLDPTQVYTNNQSLSISCTTEGAIVKYTTDGTDPNETSKTYTGPITLDSTTTVRAIAIKTGLTPSSILSNTYTLNVVNGTELIKNGDFSKGTENWLSSNDVDSTPSGVVNGEYKTTINNVGPYSYSYELGQGDFKLHAGLKYRLTFDARSTIARKIEAVIEQDALGYTRYFDMITPITTDMKTYTYDFTATTDEEVAHLAFSMGNVDNIGTLTPHDVYIDNVSFKEIPEICANPSFNVGGGTYSSEQTVIISSATEGATIRYTLDGSDPTSNSTVYTSPIKVNYNTTIKAYASKQGLIDSRVFGATYKFAPTAEPCFNLSSGTYSSAQTVSINCATEGAVIRYTTDGSAPSINSPIYSNPITISSNTTIKAYAYKGCHLDSNIVTAVYSINIPSTPTKEPTTPSTNQNQSPGSPESYTPSTNTSNNAPSTSNITPASGSTENSNVIKLPKTGSAIDISFLLLLGTLTFIFGLSILNYKKRNISK